MANNVERYHDELTKIFGPGRFFYDEEIMKVYAHDLGSPPKTVDFLINRMPDAVVLPKDENQVIQLLKLATVAKIPVTPRGMATSGYGGAVPAKGGIVVDLSQLNREITPNAEQQTVTVDPGVLIWDLERELNRHGLALLTYPTSAPSASIGGFVCQGGVGMGAFQYGPISTQVERARLVLPNGDVKTFTGKELEVVADCEGITGIVTKLTLRVTKKTEKVPVVATFANAEQLANALEAVSKRFQPWNITFHNPTFSMLREEAGGPKTIPRKQYSAIFVFTKDQLDRVRADLTNVITQAGGKLLPDAVAATEWGEIFYTLRAKALGPSLAPGEVVFPLSKLHKFLTTCDQRFGYSPLSMEGTLIQGGFVTILAFALEDERRVAYPLGFSAGIQLIGIAKDLGGRAYAPGVYLATESKSIFGNRRYRRILDFKAAVDKSKIMNPGKILSIRPRPKAVMLGIPPVPAPPGAPMSTVAQILNAKPAVWLMSKAAPTFAYARPSDNAAQMVAVNRSIAMTQGGWFGNKNEWHAYDCSQCGFCIPDAPMSQAVGMEFGNPRSLLYIARLYLQGNLEITKKVEEVVAGLSESYIKDEVCPSRIPISQLAKDFRAQLEHDLGRPLQVPAGLRQRIQTAETQLAERQKRFDTPVQAPAPAPTAPAPKPTHAPTPAKAPPPPPMSGVTPGAKPAPQ